MRGVKRRVSWRWAVVCLWPTLAFAGSVYLNGVNIDGVTGQKFEKCTVRIDDNGNVFIDAPGYRAQVVQGAPAPAPTPPAPAPQAAPQQAPQTTQPQAVQYPPQAVVLPYPVMQAPQYAPPPATAPATTPPPAAAKITKRYWLVANQNAPGLPEYEIDVYLNAKWLMKLKENSEQDVVDITKYLVPGKNAVLFEAHKLSGDVRKSYSADHVYSVVVGEGNEGGGNVMIDNPQVQYRKTAADTDSTSREFTFTTR